MNFNSLKPILLLSLTLASTRGSAESLPDLSNYFAHEIKAVDGVVCTESLPDMTLQALNVDISPSVSFGIGSVLSISVTPEIDLVFVPNE